LHGNGAATTVESAFGRSLRERAAQIQHRHAWKSQGRGAQFMGGAMWANQDAGAAEMPISITSVARGRSAGQLLYSLETDAISGVFVSEPSGEERRIFHTADFRVRHLAPSPDGETLAASIFHPKSMTANIAMLQVEGSEFREITEGDSQDAAPRWELESSRKRLVFQSAGLGRDAAGRFLALGPYAVQQLDFDSGDIETVAEDAEADLLCPQKIAGELYYIRRPHETGQRKLSPLTALKDTALFPFRMGLAFFQYFNFFSMRYTGKPLATSKGAAQRQPDLKQMMIWGNLINATEAAQQKLGDADAPSLVPHSWQLVRRSSNGAKDVLAKGVLSFDLAKDGSVIYSNGSAIYRLPAGGRAERIFAGSLIEQVAFV
jgi:hypothetical protein